MDGAASLRPEALASNVERAILTQTRRALRLALAHPRFRARGLKAVRELTVPGAQTLLPARLYEPGEPIDGPLIVYFHGGGFVCCDIDTHDALCSWLAHSSGLKLVSVGYRLAPETRFPGQLKDARAACAWALEQASALGMRADQIIVAGDSAGAYLAANCAVELNAARANTVAYQALLYPLVHIEDVLWAAEEIRNFRFVGRMAVKYIARSLGAERFSSLCDLDLTHAPTTFLAGGGALDPVRADVKSFSGALRGAGVRVVEKKYPALIHGGLNLTAVSKLAVTALGDVGTALRAELTA